MEEEIIGKDIITSLYQNKMILTWYNDNPQGYKLASGNWSPFYINLRNLTAFPSILKKVGRALAGLIKNKIIKENSNKRYVLVGLAMAGIPICTAISLEGNIPAAFTRKIENNKIENFESIIKQYGKHSLIEGRLETNDNIILIDDLVSFFTSKEQAIKLIQFEAKKRNINININDIIVLIDREQGGKEEAEKYGINLTSLIPFKSKGVSWLKPALKKEEYNIIKDYLANSQEYQKPSKQQEIAKLSPLYK